ncbi:MAG: sugar phosphate isomerase/epimerase family protein [Cyclobacteriaceae bacterium]|jgi:sugar phosphate isomerase/epimerase|nr:sugar phosphate isomerase/epimerase [Flammeovirgaceae bacterium]
MRIKYVCPYWGLEGTSPTDFFKKVLEEGYDGVEINLPDSREFIEEFQLKLERIRNTNPNFIFISQQVLSLRHERVEEYIERMTKRLEELVALRPDFINSHTGKDYFSFEDNCRVIEAAENIAHQSGIPILHETHRGRFTFHAASLLPYLEIFPQLKLTGDFSHWCTVSESLLSDQIEILDRIIPYIYHLHARVGSAQAPQVNDPFAPEWKGNLETFIGWWKKIIDVRSKTKDSILTICPEFGPIPYMPTMPVSQTPLCDQWETNSRIKNRLQIEFALHH